MRFEVEPEIVLINYFFYHPQETITPKGINYLRQKIYKKVKDDIYVDLTSNSIIGAVKRHCDKFYWDENNLENIIRVKKSDKYYTEEYLDLINFQVPSNILKGIQKACKTPLPKSL